MLAMLPNPANRSALWSSLHLMAQALETATAQFTHLFSANTTSAANTEPAIKVRLEEAVTVPCRFEALYAHCRCPDNLVWFLEPVRAVQEIRPNRFHWQLGDEQALEMRLSVAEYGERIVWESTRQHDLGLRVEITLAEAENCFETNVQVRLEFRAADDAQVRRLATLLGEDPEGKLQRGLEALIEMYA